MYMHKNDSIVFISKRKCFKILRISKHISHYICPTFHENLIVYDEMWRSILQSGWPKLTEVVTQYRKDALCMTDS